jgi:hypothetical protein
MDSAGEVHFGIGEWKAASRMFRRFLVVVKDVKRRGALRGKKSVKRGTPLSKELVGRQ